MAKAKANIETVRTVKSVTLTLNGPESAVLLYVCNNIAGSPHNSGRAVIDNIGRALVEAGVTAPAAYDTEAHEGKFSFRDGSLAAFIPTFKE